MNRVNYNLQTYPMQRYNELIPYFKLAESCSAKEPITLRLRGPRVAA